MSKLIYGVCFNSKGKHKTRIDGKRTNAYQTWVNMIQRCYSPIYQDRHPTYKECVVDEKWLDFQDFAEWFSSQDYNYAGYQLDKDILMPNNKIYSPDTCCFVPQEINLLLVDCGASRGKYPQGVHFVTRDRKFQAKLGINGKSKYIGYFDCPKEAHLAYKEAKEVYIKSKALEWQDRIARDVFDALMVWSLN